MDAILLISLFSSLASSAQRSGENENSPATNPEYRIARWYGFKQAAFSITFDDNTRLQFTHALPLLNEHNYKATFFIVTNWVREKVMSPGWDTLNMVALQGHEIGSHSKNHANFDTLSLNPQYADSMRRELEDSRNTINAHIHSQQCETFCWPGGAVTDSAIAVADKYYMACRGSNNYYNGPVPYNFYNIYSQHIYHSTPLVVVDSYINDILFREGWLVERWHGFRVGQDTCGYEPVPIEIFQDHLNYVAQKEDSLWISPMHNVVKYIRERENSTLTVVDTTPSSIIMSLTDNLPDTLFHYNLPLSLKVRLNGKLASLTGITQNNVPLSYTIKTEDGGKYVYFDAVPNSGLIDCLTAPKSVSGIQSSGPDFPRVYPNPFASASTVIFDVSEPELVYIRVYNSQGIMVKNYSRNCSSGPNKVTIDAGDLPSGVYCCCLESHETISVLRMILTH